MRAEASIVHLDLDAFFAAVEQRDKPSLRGRPVVVGGTGPRGVVATASYEARVFGARSAMATAEARRRCPAGTAFLTPRSAAYRTSSRVVMDLLAELSPVVEQVSVDEAYVDLAAPGTHDLSADGVRRLMSSLLERIELETGGLTASVGVASSKMLAKIGSELDKPHGLVVVPPGQELEVLSPLGVRAISGVGPATADRLRGFGITTVAELQRMTLSDLVSIVGEAHGQGLYRLARAQDDRAVVVEREAKSVSAEETFTVDVTDRRRLVAELASLVAGICRRLTDGGAFARTVTIKVRHHDFSTHTRSATLRHATAEPDVVLRTARRLLDGVDVSGGLRLLGVGLSGFVPHAQDELGLETPLLAGRPDEGEGHDHPYEPQTEPEVRVPDGADAGAYGPLSRRQAPGEWRTGEDVEHAERGPGWVWGSGIGRVSVRFEGPRTGPGPIATFSGDDPELSRADPPDWRAARPEEA